MRPSVAPAAALISALAACTTGPLNPCLSSNNPFVRHEATIVEAATEREVRRLIRAVRAASDETPAVTQTPDPRRGTPLVVQVGFDPAGRVEAVLDRSRVVGSVETLRCHGR